MRGYLRPIVNYFGVIRSMCLERYSLLSSSFAFRAVFCTMGDERGLQKLSLDNCCKPSSIFVQYRE